MKSLGIAGIYVTAVGLVILAVQSYDYDPGFLIGMAIVGVGLIVLAMTRKNGNG